MRNCSQFLNSKVDATICDEIQYGVSQVLSGFNVDVVKTGVKVRFKNLCLWTWEAASLSLGLNQK